MKTNEKTKALILFVDNSTTNRTFVCGIVLRRARRESRKLFTDIKKYLSSTYEYGGCVIDIYHHISFKINPFTATDMLAGETIDTDISNKSFKIFTL